MRSVNISLNKFLMLKSIISQLRRNYGKYLCRATIKVTFLYTFPTHAIQCDSPSSRLPPFMISIFQISVFSFLFSPPRQEKTERFRESAYSGIKGSSWYISLIRKKNRSINISPWKFDFIFILLRHVCATSVKKVLLMYASRLKFRSFHWNVK